LLEAVELFHAVESSHHQMQVVVSNILSVRQDNREFIDRTGVVLIRDVLAIDEIEQPTFQNGAMSFWFKDVLLRGLRASWNGVRLERVHFIIIWNGFILKKKVFPGMDEFLVPAVNYPNIVVNYDRDFILASAVRICPLVGDCKINRHEIFLNSPTVGIVVVEMTSNTMEDYMIDQMKDWILASGDDFLDWDLVREDEDLLEGEMIKHVETKAVVGTESMLILGLPLRWSGRTPLEPKYEVGTYRFCSRNHYGNCRCPPMNENSKHERLIRVSTTEFEMFPSIDEEPDHSTEDDEEDEQRLQDYYNRDRVFTFDAGWSYEDERDLN
jgi:hypothetical protein